MTEWELQRELTKKWAGRDGVSIGGRRLMLVAWEVMVPSWDINSPTGRFNQPSLDFLLADDELNLAVVELKREIVGQVSAWRALCQVTHSAIKVGETFRLELLDKAWRHCWSKSIKVARRPIANSVIEEHKVFFGRTESVKPSTLNNGSAPVQRVVAALRFGPQWETILEAFNTLKPDVLRETLEPLSLPKARRDIKRYLGSAPERFLASATPVSSLLVDSKS